MRFALLGKCFAVGERVERMETLEFEEVRIYRINVSGRNCEPRPPRMGHFERVGMLIVAMLNFELLRAFFFVTFIALIICFFHGFSILLLVKKFSGKRWIMMECTVKKRRMGT